MRYLHATAHTGLAVQSKPSLWPANSLILPTFAIIAASTLVRAEGIIIFGILSILFFIFNKRDKKIIGKFFLAIFIFVIIFFSMTLIKSETNEDGLESTSALNIGEWVGNTITNQNNQVIQNIDTGFETFVKRIAQSMIPYFALFVPFGIILALKDKNKNKILILILLLIYLAALIRMYSVVSDGRLLLVLFPLFGIFSVYTIRYFTDKFEFKKISLILIISACLILSIYFLYSNDELTMRLIKDNICNELVLKKYFFTIRMRFEIIVAYILSSCTVNKKKYIRNTIYELVIYKPNDINCLGKYYHC